MDRTERFYRIEQLLQDRKLVPLRDFLDELEVSRATFKRDIEYLRDRLHAPIEYDRDAGGYRFGKPAQAQGGPRHELPGLWFNASEVHALLTMQHLLKGVEPGLLAPHVDPLLARLRGMLATDDLSVPEVERRIKIIRMAARKMKPAYFEVAAPATLKRRRLAVRYWSRYTAGKGGGNAVAGWGDLGDMYPEWRNWSNLTPSEQPGTWFQEASGYWYFTLAPDIASDTDTFSNARTAMRSLMPCFRVGINRIGDVRIVQVGERLSGTLDGVITDWQNRTQTKNNYARGMRSDTAGRLVGSPVVDALVPEMLTRRTWWYAP